MKRKNHIKFLVLHGSVSKPGTKYIQRAEQKDLIVSHISIMQDQLVTQIISLLTQRVQSG